MKFESYNSLVPVPEEKDASFERNTEILEKYKRKFLRFAKITLTTGFLGFAAIEGSKSVDDYQKYQVHIESESLE